MTAPELKEEQDGPVGSSSGEGQARPHEPSPIQLRLPATSANLGPGFDALGLALSLFLTIQARCAPVFSIVARGRDADVTGSLESNLIRTTYEAILTEKGRAVLPLALIVDNQIPLGMGCGSSAAALCAGVLLANHFGDLRWGPDEVLHEAARREGHPDNVAACLLGGLTASKTMPSKPETGAPGQTIAVSLGSDLPWRLLLALPYAGLSTATARLLLPDVYSRGDAVRNVQSTALLIGAFALNRPDLLTAATEDSLHQPYRMQVCPLLGALLPLAGKDGVHSVTLSGAGPAVLLVVAGETSPDIIHRAARGNIAEILELSIACGAKLTPVIS